MYNIYIYIHRNSITCLLDYMYIFTYKQIFHGVGLSLKKSVIEEPYVGPVVASIFFVSQDHHHQDHHHSRGSRDSRSVGSKSKAPWLGLTHAFIFLYIEYIFIMYIYIYIYLCIVFKINIYIYTFVVLHMCVANQIGCQISAIRPCPPSPSRSRCRPTLNVRQIVNTRMGRYFVVLILERKHVFVY